MVIDWLLQNEWVAKNKSDLRHWAAWIHSGAHACALMLVFPIEVALVIGIIHLLIDTRKPLGWWSRVFQQTRTGGIGLIVAIASDQVLHLLIIAIAALILGAR